MKIEVMGHRSAVSPGLPPIPFPSVELPEYSYPLTRIQVSQKEPPMHGKHSSGVWWYQGEITQYLYDASWCRICWTHLFRRDIHAYIHTSLVLNDEMTYVQNSELIVMTHQPPQLSCWVVSEPVCVCVMSFQLNLVLHNSLIPNSLVGFRPFTTPEIIWKQNTLGKIQGKIHTLYNVE